MADPVVSEPVREDVQSAIAKALRRHCEPLPHPARAEEFGAFFDPCGDARVVLLGEAILSDQFDAYVWFEETHAVTPLPAERPQGAPETYPFGL